MTSERGHFLQHLRATFRIEAAEHLLTIGRGLLELEKISDPELQRGVVELVFRAAHSLKGAARAVEFKQIEAVCQSLEETFSSWKRQESTPSAQVLDALHTQLNSITAFLASVQQDAVQPGRDGAVAGPALRAPAVELAAQVPSGNAAAAPLMDTVRVSVALLDAVMVEIGEMVSAKLAARRRVDDLRELAGVATAPAAASGVHPQETPIAEKFSGLVRRAEHERDAVEKQIDELLETSKQLLLLPLSTVTALLPKLVRDLSRDLGKEVELQIDGEHLEIDKRILEQIKDPLIHLLRNCVDHGIEAPAERSRRGKPARARITLEASQTSGGKLQLVIRDDGAGIDTVKVVASAVNRALLSAAEAGRLTEAQRLALVFRSNVSTREVLTAISGRGLGLAIVREKVAKLGGDVSVESRLGVGTVFRIVVPAPRTTFRGILVEAGARLLVIPTADVQRAARVRPGDVRTVEGRDTIALDGRALPLVVLASVLALPPAPPRAVPAREVALLVLGSGEQSIAYAVDEVLGEQEMMVKPLVRPLSRVRNVSAAALLGDGRLAPILSVPDLLGSAASNAGAPLRVAAAAPAPEQKTVLVAEDSITSRTLIQGILEAAGYLVATAVDGLDAFARLRSEPFDLLVSDVEMPRLNGFDLTARIRADPKLGELPVVLVTALETGQDRERGIDVGASAYIVKSGFDQSTLIDAVRRLI